MTFDPYLAVHDAYEADSDEGRRFIQLMDEAAAREGSLCQNQHEYPEAALIAAMAVRMIRTAPCSRVSCEAGCERCSYAKAISTLDQRRISRLRASRIAPDAISDPPATDAPPERPQGLTRALDILATWRELDRLGLVMPRWFGHGRPSDAQLLDWLGAARRLIDEERSRR